MTLDKAQQDQIMRIGATVSASLSFFGAVFILLRYYSGRKHELKASANAANEFVRILAWLDLLLAVGHGASIYPTRTFDADAGEPVTNICNLQAFDIMGTNMALTAWNFFMAYNLFRWVCYADDQVVLQSRIRLYLLVTLVFGYGIATFGLFDHAYNDAELWCMLAIHDNPTKDALWKYGGMYLWVFLGIIAMIVMLVRVRQNVEARVEGVLSNEAKAAYLNIVRNQSWLIIGFVICWVPGLTHRTVSLMMGVKEVYPFNIVHATVRPLQGFVNAVVFGHFHRWFAAKLRGDGYVDSPREGATPDFTTLVDIEDRENKQFTAARASIFMTAIDLNWSAFPTKIDSWIPAGSDIYVVTLVNCSSVRAAEDIVGQHLVKINSPAGFRSVTSLAGSTRQAGSHGAQVCQLVFVTDSDVESGNLEYKTSDTHLWTFGKPLYQAVGITMRYYDATLSVVSCNALIAGGGVAPPDAKPRITGMRQARALGLNADCCHHTFLSGMLDSGVDCVSHSIPQKHGALQQQRSWTESDSSRIAACSLLNLEVDKLFAMD